MNALAGANLAARAKSGSPGNIVEMLAFALRACHSVSAEDCPFQAYVPGESLVHGDACPPNIIIGDDGSNGYIDLGDRGVGDVEAGRLWSMYAGAMSAKPVAGCHGVARCDGQPCFQVRVEASLCRRPVTRPQLAAGGAVVSAMRSAKLPRCPGASVTTLGAAARSRVAAWPIWAPPTPETKESPLTPPGQAPSARPMMRAAPANEAALKTRAAPRFSTAGRRR